MWLLKIERLAYRAKTSLFFTVESSVVSLATVDVSCAISLRSLALAVAKFEMASTVYWWRYPSSKFLVALCSAP